MEKVFGYAIKHLEGKIQRLATHSKKYEAGSKTHVDFLTELTKWRTELDKIKDLQKR